MRTHEVVIEMAFLVLKKMKIFPKLCEMTEKTAFFEKSLNVNATKREHVDENLNHISFVT